MSAAAPLAPPSQWIPGLPLACVRDPNQRARPSPLWGTLLPSRAGLRMTGPRALWITAPRGTRLASCELLSDGFTLVFERDGSPVGHARLLFVRPRGIAGRISPGLALHLAGDATVELTQEASNFLLQRAAGDLTGLRLQEADDGFRFAFAWSEGSLPEIIERTSELVRVELDSYYARSRGALLRLGAHLPAPGADPARLGIAYCALRGYTHALLNHSPELLRRPAAQSDPATAARLDLLAPAWLPFNARIAGLLVQQQMRLQRRDGRIPGIVVEDTLLGSAGGTTLPILSWLVRDAIGAETRALLSNLFPQLLWHLQWIQSRLGRIDQNPPDGAPPGEPGPNSIEAVPELSPQLLPADPGCRRALLLVELDAFFEIAAQLDKGDDPALAPLQTWRASLGEWAGQQVPGGATADVVGGVLCRAGLGRLRELRSSAPPARWDLAGLPGPPGAWLPPVMLATALARKADARDWVEALATLQATLAEAIPFAAVPPAELPVASDQWSATTPEDAAEPDLATGVAGTLCAHRTLPPAILPDEAQVTITPYISAALASAVAGQRRASAPVMPPVELPAPPAIHPQPRRRRSSRRSRRRRRGRFWRMLNRITALAAVAAALTAGGYYLWRIRRPQGSTRLQIERALQMAELLGKPQEALAILDSLPADTAELRAARARILLGSLRDPVAARALLEQDPAIPEDPGRAPSALLDLYADTLRALGLTDEADRMAAARKAEPAGPPSEPAGMRE